MKASNSKVIPFNSRKGYRYPNQAERGYLFEKALDTALTIASSAGITAVILFFILL